MRHQHPHAALLAVLSAWAMGFPAPRLQRGKINRHLSFNTLTKVQDLMGQLSQGHSLLKKRLFKGEFEHLEISFKINHF